MLKNHGSSLAAVKPLGVATDSLFQFFAAANLPSASPPCRRDANRENAGEKGGEN